MPPAETWYRKVLAGRARIDLVDGLAFGIAVSLPWSTTASSVLIVLWLIAFARKFPVSAVLQELTSAAGGLPVALWILAAVGTLWSNATWAESLEAMRSFHKFLAVPLLIAQFRTSEHAPTILFGFLASSCVLLAWSDATLLWPTLARHYSTMPGVPVKDYIAQSAEFVLCAFGCFYLALDEWQRDRRAAAAAALVLGFLFLLNLAYVTTARAALLVIPALLLLLVLRRIGRRAGIIVCSSAVIVLAILWSTSPYLRARVLNTFTELERYETSNAETSVGLRLELWRKSLGFVREAPLVGHGTGSVKDLFRKAQVGFAGSSSVVVDNPHNQTLAVAVQLGIAGLIVLYAMWAVHLLLFWRRTGLPADVGTMVVVQNIVFSLFNSHLFDFTPGWIYVFAVGMLCGTVQRREQHGAAAPAHPPGDKSASPFAVRVTPGDRGQA